MDEKILEAMKRITRAAAKPDAFLYENQAGWLHCTCCDGEELGEKRAGSDDWDERVATFTHDTECVALLAQETEKAIA
jgi:hypothetical protein